jgi:hypothetical protein
MVEAVDLYAYNIISTTVLLAINNYFAIHATQLGVQDVKTTKLSRSIRTNTNAIRLKQTSQSPSSVKRMFCSWLESKPSCPGYSHSVWGRDSSVGIATRYGLVGPGIESRLERKVPHPPRPTLGPTRPPIQWVPGLFPVVRAAGAWR